jgi:hypothetical protein
MVIFERKKLLTGLISQILIKKGQNTKNIFWIFGGRVEVCGGVWEVREKVEWKRTRLVAFYYENISDVHDILVYIMNILNLIH